MRDQDRGYGQSDRVLAQTGVQGYLDRIEKALGAACEVEVGLAHLGDVMDGDAGPTVPHAGAAPTPTHLLGRLAAVATELEGLASRLQADRARLERALG
jgi:hypothetical protein